MAASKDSTAKILEEEKAAQELEELQKTWHIVLSNEEETRLTALKEAFDLPVMQSTVELIKKHPEGLLQRLSVAKDVAGSRVVKYYANELAQNIDAAEKYQRFILAISLINQMRGALNTATSTPNDDDDEEFVIDDTQTPTTTKDNNNNNAINNPAVPSLWNPINAVGYVASGANSTASAAATSISNAFGFMFSRQRPASTTININTNAFTQEPLTNIATLDDYVAPNNNDTEEQDRKEREELARKEELERKEREDLAKKEELERKEREDLAKKEELERKEREDLAKKEELERKEREELAKKEELERKEREDLAKKEELERNLREENARKEAEQLRLQKETADLLLLKQQQERSCRTETKELTTQEKINYFISQGF